MIFINIVSLLLVAFTLLFFDFVSSGLAYLVFCFLVLLSISSLGVYHSKTTVPRKYLFFNLVPTAALVYSLLVAPELLTRNFPSVTILFLLCLPSFINARPGLIKAALKLLSCYCFYFWPLYGFYRLVIPARPDSPYLGIGYILFMLSLPALYFSSTYLSAKSHKIYSLLFCSVAILALLVNGLRAALVSFVLFLILSKLRVVWDWVVQYFQNSNPLKVTLFSTLLFACVLVITALYAFPDFILSFLNSLGGSIRIFSKASTRTVVWGVSLDYILNDPLLGKGLTFDIKNITFDFSGLGLGLVRDTITSHSDFIESLLKGGLVMFFLMCLSISNIISRISRNLCEISRSVGLHFLCLIIFFSTSSSVLVFPYFWQIPMIYMLFICLYSCQGLPFRSITPQGFGNY